MATLIACANGDLTNAATWATVDATSLLNAENGGTVVGTSVARSSTFTPGAITIDGIAVKLNARNGTTGTWTVRLDQGTTAVTGTTVTINCSDVPANTTAAALNGGWIFFKFAAPVTLVAATAYSVAYLSSSASQITLWRDATASNVCRMLRTTTTAAPAAGDNMVICREWTAGGTSTTRTVTMNSTTATDYGAASTSLITPALAICDGGTLTWGTSAATNYILQLSGHLIAYAGGVHNMGTTGTPCPRDSTMTLQMDCGSNDAFYSTYRNGSTWTAQGQSRTSGKNEWCCFLDANAAVNATSLTVDRDTGWLDNDEIGISSTTFTSTQREKGTLNGNAGSSTLTVDGFAGAGGGLAFAHDGGDTDVYIVAEIILLTRNVVYKPVNSSFRTNVQIHATAIVDLDWVQFSFCGSTGGLSGITYNTTTGSFSMRYCSYHDGSLYGIVGVGSAIDNFEFVGLALYNSCTTANGFSIPTTSGASWQIDGLWSMGGTGLSNVTGVVDIGSLGGTLINDVRVSSTTLSQFRLFHSSAAFIPQGRVTNICSHSAAGFSQNNTGFYNGWITNLTLYQTNATWGGTNSYPHPASTMIIEDLVAIGVTDTNNMFMVHEGPHNITFINPLIAGTSSVPLAGFVQRNGTGILQVHGGILGQASGIRTVMSSYVWTCNQSPWEQDQHIFGSTVNATLGLVDFTALGQSRFARDVGIHYTGLNGDVNQNYTYIGTGDISSDITTYHSAAPSEKLMPKFAAWTDQRHKSSSHYVAVNASEAKTIVVWVYKDASYAGLQPRLMLKANGALGTNYDTVLATMTGSALNWEALVGVAPVAAMRGAWEVYVDCTGTAGAVYVDDWAVS